MSRSSQEQGDSPGPVAQEDEHVNQVRLVGRVSGPPEHRVLPSGDELWVCRLVVRRPVASGGSRQRVDVLDCAAWTPRVRRTVGGWRDGDLVEVHGAVRRRFFRGAGGTASRVEVELARARVTRRAATS